MGKVEYEEPSVQVNERRAEEVMKEYTAAEK